MTNTDTNTVATAETPDKTKEAVAKLQAKLAGKSPRIVFEDEYQDPEIIDALIAALGGETNIQNWAEKAPQGFDTPALVKTKGGVLRTIAIASAELVFANENCKRRLYDAYQSLVVGKAMKDDAEEAQFITVDGCMRVKFDEAAFDALSNVFMKLFRNRKQPINKRILQASLENSAYAAGMFPKMEQKQWQIMLSKMIEMATAKGMDTTLFEHWVNTRDALRDTSVAIAFDWEKDLAEAVADVEEAASEKEAA